MASAVTPSPAERCGCNCGGGLVSVGGGAGVAAMPIVPPCSGTVAFTVTVGGGGGDLATDGCG
eukprot:2222039-Prorocentrum_lima.AAC.1